MLYEEEEVVVEGGLPGHRLSLDLYPCSSARAGTWLSMWQRSSRHRLSRDLHPCSSQDVGTWLSMWRPVEICILEDLRMSAHGFLKWNAVESRSDQSRHRLSLDLHPCSSARAGTRLSMWQAFESRDRRADTDSRWTCILEAQPGRAHGFQDGDDQADTDSHGVKKLHLCILEALRMSARGFRCGDRSRVVIVARFHRNDTDSHTICILEDLRMSARGFRCGKPSRVVIVEPTPTPTGPASSKISGCRHAAFSMESGRES